MVSTQEINDAFAVKLRDGIFDPVARYLWNPSTAEDLLQDAICMTWEFYRRKMMEGEESLSLSFCFLDGIARK